MLFASIPVWTYWNFEPLPLLALAAVTGAYVYALGPLRRRQRPAEPVNRVKVVSFSVGMALLALALVSPLDTVGMHYLLTMHMVQHMFFSVICPPLLLFGTPEWMVTPLFRNPLVGRIGRFLTHPVVAFGLYNANMWFWHMPPIFDATPPRWSVAGEQLLDNAALVAALLVAGVVVLPTLRRRRRDATSAARAAGGASLGLLAAFAGLLAVFALAGAGALDSSSWSAASEAHNPIHQLMSALFIVTALLYWCPILSPTPALPRISPLFGMLYMFMSTQPMMALGAILTFAPTPLFETYRNAPLIWGATRLGDQQLAGLIMWLPMDIPLFVAITVLFFRWIDSHDKQERAEAGEFDEDYDDVEDLVWSESGWVPRHTGHVRRADVAPVEREDSAPALPGAQVGG